MGIPTLEQIVDGIIEAEGGLSTNTDDHGGITKHGISLRYAKGKGLDLDGDGDVDGDDIRLVDVPTAKELFLQDFFYAPKVCDLPPGLWPQVFDTSVNSGPSRAIKLVQEVLIDLGQALIADGKMGPNTQRAAKLTCERHGTDKVNNMLSDKRADFYRAIVAADPSQKVFIDGWLRRARTFHTKKDAH